MMGGMCLVFWCQYQDTRRIFCGQVLECGFQIAAWMSLLENMAMGVMSRDLSATIKALLVGR